MAVDTMEQIVSLCKRKGFIFQSSEIYGGLNGCWDYGPLGVELKRNVQDAWWRAMTVEEDDIEGLDASILMHPRVWEASGHVAEFTDPLVDCTHCKARFRDDQIEKEGQCPACGMKGTLTAPRKFNLMLKTFIGPVEEAASVVYLRPETCQGIYVDYQNIMTAMRRRIPFGIAQIGKAFRNEINPRYFVFRSREFEQMEMQYFVKPGMDMDVFNAWRDKRLRYYAELGIRPEKLRLVPHEKLAHYASAAVDIEYEFPFGWGEIEGIHNRTDFDLRRHSEFSGKDLSFFDDQTRERYIPFIIEASSGVNRTLLAYLCDAYEVEQLENDTRTVLHLHPRLAPVKAGIFPLVKRDGMPEKARQIERQLNPYFRVFYDESGAVGRRYRRMDEVGTPFCITVDSQTMQDDTVTLRDRDTMLQERYPVAGLVQVLGEKIASWKRP
ncbi:MAG TPA: glycine--tRNA ligase [Candidatus Latescibacteria bacterium]|nr:glycine--tRNA ligase [Candidatus Latescibacterota bacterium]HPC46172.1 glycine--tRNA ligase [Candidatus Latescibacterota bacterium]HQK22216.1 glycine--tRNA ligase [Candidatus Latescibacterota bacterium]HRU23096.1 glycine--tRNA ligase [Candidatus Latescibacterota bacterium]